GGASAASRRPCLGPGCDASGGRRRESASEPRAGAERGGAGAPGPEASAGPAAEAAARPDDGALAALAVGAGDAAGGLGGVAAESSGCAGGGASPGLDPGAAGPDREGRVPADGLSADELRPSALPGPCLRLLDRSAYRLERDDRRPAPDLRELQAHGGARPGAGGAGRREAAAGPARGGDRAPVPAGAGRA